MLLSIAITAQAAPSTAFELRVLTHDSTDATRQVLQAFRRRFPALQASSDIGALSARPGPAVYVAIGPGALQAALVAELRGPLLSLFTSNETYTRLVAQHPRRRSHALTTAIYAEASPTDQMTLIRQIYGRRVLVGVLLSSGTAHLGPTLTRAAQAADLDIEVQTVAQGDSAVRALNRLASAAVLLTVPDQALYTAESMRNIIESTYRRNQPVVGFSPALVTAGTLASAYASIDDTLAQLAEKLDGLAAGRVFKPQYPEYWQVAINDNVAHSLNIVIDDAVRVLGNRPR